MHILFYQIKCGEGFCNVLYFLVHSYIHVLPDRFLFKLMNIHTPIRVLVAALLCGDRFYSSCLDKNVET